MRLTLKRLVLFLVGVAILGAAVMWSGIIGTTASSGHWAITDLVLHYAMRRSVKTHSMGIEVPSLDDPALVHQGAGHFATGCAPCHGAPGTPPSVVAQEMTPPPPRLAGRIDEWEPEELFWIVMHGVKFTGMPAWPALGRDDEVWSMVAFLQKLPELEVTEYNRLAFGPLALGQASLDPGFEALAGASTDPIARCVRCHGRDGAGRGIGAFPLLTGQSEAYLLASLRAYASGERHSGMMQPMANPLDQDEMERLAHHYAEARLAEPITRPAADPAAIERGEKIVHEGIPTEGVPPCAGCHAPDGTRRHPVYPLLGGQYAGYIVNQLRAFKAGTRGGTPYSHLMATVASRLTDRQMRDAAAYLSSLPSENGLR